MIEKEQYPNCERLVEVSDKHRTIMEFLDSVESEAQLAYWHHDDGVDNLVSVNNRQDIVLRYLGVDPQELEKERRVILDSIRS